MHHARFTALILASVLLVITAGCGRSEDNGHTHTHADGTTHADHAPAEGHAGEDHEHDEVPIGTVTIGDMQVELAQGHGPVRAGHESHLVVKLPYSDNGQTIVRAWIGTQDRTLSYVGRGDYSASHDDYDIHATAPDPLPENAKWWIEIERPNGERAVGSAEPIME
jgi:hypothetical protein